MSNNFEIMEKHLNGFFTVKINGIENIVVRECFSWGNDEDDEDESFGFLIFNKVSSCVPYGWVSPLFSQELRENIKQFEIDCGNHKDEK